MSELQIKNYEELRQREDVIYDEIKTMKKKTEMNHLEVKSRHRWFKQFLLILLISVFSAGVASTITYLTVCGKSEIRAQLKQLTLDLIDMKKQINDNTDRVGFTAFGEGYGNRSSGYQLKFPNFESSIGISNLSSIKNTGTFICEKKGLYLVIVTVMACSKGDSVFYIYKNNQKFMFYFIGRSDHFKEDCHSGTGTAVVELDVNDTMDVRNFNSGVILYENQSSFSAVKLK